MGKCVFNTLQKKARNMDKYKQNIELLRKNEKTYVLVILQ